MFGIFESDDGCNGHHFQDIEDGIVTGIESATWKLFSDLEIDGDRRVRTHIPDSYRGGRIENHGDVKLTPVKKRIRLKCVHDGCSEKKEQTSVVAWYSNEEDEFYDTPEDYFQQ